ncbi:unnamed protein product [Paramecium pentaurelia]|uniref:Uncharacterized protein n=1 Tax=Paramecium pentaurelia TaxID=43138 RepID=A0A8S1SE04_9CILI|nr:unnamed protein product [Paramecium pentaurelia]
MKTFFTEMDCKSDQLLLKEINSLFMRLNFESPRTQQAMKELNLTKQQCQIKNLSEFLQYHNEIDAMYLNHLQLLKDNLSILVNRRREIIGPSIKIVFTTPKQSKQFNFLKKIFDHDLKQLYQSEMLIKQQQQKNTDKIFKQVEDTLKSISNKAKVHNNTVERKLSLLKQSREDDLDDRLNKSLDFDSKFEPIQKSLQESKTKFKVMMSSKTQQLLDYHLEKKKNIIDQEELRRTNLQFNTIEKSQRNSHFKQGISSQDRIELVQKQEQEQQQNVITKIVKSIQKTSIQTQQNQSIMQNTVQKMKEVQDKKINKVQQNLTSKSLMQSERENTITQDIQDKIISSNTKAKQRLLDIQSKLRNLSQQKQEKQQELLNNYTNKMEKRNETIIEKHLKLRQKLKKSQNSNKNMVQQQHQLIIEKDEFNQNITKAQRLIVTKPTKNIEELLNHVLFN